MCVPKPVVLVKGIGCSFRLACVSTPVGTKALESATARFKSCSRDYYINKIALNESSHLSTPSLLNYKMFQQYIPFE